MPKLYTNYLNMNLLEQIVTNIVRPTRDQYHISRLGHSLFTIFIASQQQSFPVTRYDHQLINKSNQNIEVSYYANTAAEPDSCVVYLHANNGSRVEGLQYLNGLLNAKFNVCLFDCSGSGLSGGQYISLGFKESYDLQCVINHLRSEMKVKRIILWGRSMGACTAIIYANRHPETVEGLILDSPFKDLRKLIKELGSERTCLPKCFFEPLMPFISDELHKKTGYTLEDYKLKKYLSNLSKVPALFLVSKQDKLVKPHHGQKLYTRYPAKNKQLEYINIQHHENRTNEIISKCISFIKFALTPKLKTTLKRSNEATMTSRTMNSKESKYYQNASLKMDTRQNGSTRTSCQDLNFSSKLSKVNSKVSLKEHLLPKNQKPKLSLASIDRR